MEPIPALPFADRASAGRALAHLVRERLAGLDLILALPRGGVAIGAEIAATLNVPLDVFLVRKIGAPEQPELAIGALAETGHLEFNRRVLENVLLDQSALSELLDVIHSPFDDHPGHEELAGFPPDWATHIEISCSS